jgi:hypothetical protein
MTFYNIIFGILFLGACRQLLHLFDTPAGWTAATIAVVIFNDVMNTSQVLESKERRNYSVPMKLIDLINFILLGLALVSLKPDDNPFQIKPANSLVTILKPWVTWLLLTLYWAFIILWNWLCGLYSRVWPKPVSIVSHALIVPFATMVVVTYSAASPENINIWLRVGVFLCPALYLLLVKPLGLRENTKKTKGSITFYIW